MVILQNHSLSSREQDKNAHSPNFCSTVKILDLGVQDNSHSPLEMWFVQAKMYSKYKAHTGF